VNSKHVLGQSFDLFLARYTGPRNAAACIRAYLKQLEYQSQFEIRTFAQAHWSDLIQLYEASLTVTEAAVHGIRADRIILDEYDGQ
jgi:hypothetical protein